MTKKKNMKEQIPPVVLEGTVPANNVEFSQVDKSCKKMNKMLDVAINKVLDVSSSVPSRQSFGDAQDSKTKKSKNKK